MDIDKLRTIPVDLSKLGNAVKILNVKWLWIA